MAFGAGTLISSLTFELTLEAYDRAGLDAVAVGLPLGALAFFVGDWLIDRAGAASTASAPAASRPRAAAAIVAGCRPRRHPRVGRHRHQPAGRRGHRHRFRGRRSSSPICPKGCRRRSGMKKAGTQHRDSSSACGSLVVAASARRRGARLRAARASAGRTLVAGIAGVRRRRHPDDARRHDDARGVRRRRPRGRPGDCLRLRAGRAAHGRRLSDRLSPVCSQSPFCGTIGASTRAPRGVRAETPWGSRHEARTHFPHDRRAGRGRSARRRACGGGGGGGLEVLGGTSASPTATPASAVPSASTASSPSPTASARADAGRAAATAATPSATTRPPATAADLEAYLAAVKPIYKEAMRIETDRR